VNIERLRMTLMRHEGLRLKPYKDSAGKLTVGVGRNLDDVGINREEAMFLLDTDLGRCEAELRGAFPWFHALDDVRQEVLMNMAFNLGVEGLKKFKATIQAVADGDYAGAAKAMMNSRWAGQVGKRAQELAVAMRSGVFKS
jgi:lysozyme